MIEHRNTFAGAAMFLATLAWFASFDPFNRPIGLDPATWDYMSVAILDGRLPYRDIFLHKTPLGAFIGAFGAATARLLGTAPLDGAHAVYLLLGAAGPALLLVLVARRTNLVVGLAAALWMLAADQWLVATLEGVRPKIATTTLGLAGLLAAESMHWRWAGLATGASVLCWQPGIAFIAGALACTRAAARGSQRTAAVGVLCWSALVPLLLLLALWAYGGLGDFFAQAVAFNTHYIDLHARTPIGTVAHLFEVLSEWNDVELLLVPVAVVAMVVAGARLPLSLAVTALAYLALVFINFQAWPDTILLAAPLAAVLAIGLDAMAGGRPLLRGAALAVAVAAALTPSAGRAYPPIDRAEQTAFVERIAEGLQPADRVLVVSYPELLVYTGRHSVWPWPYLWFGVDTFAAEHTAGGYPALIAGLHADPPALIVLARRWKGPMRTRLERWAESRYTRTELRQWPHTVRPIVVFKPRKAGESE